MREPTKPFPMAFIKYRGQFDFNGLYAMIFNYLKDRDYKPVEKKHKEKKGDFGREVEIDIWGEAEVTEYVNYKMTFKLHAWDLNPVKDKPGMDEGRIEIQLEGEVILDPKDKIKGDGRIKRAMDMFLKKVVLFRELEFKHQDRVANTLGAIQVRIRKFLNMDTGESPFESYP